jgi:hypothetical protein
MLTIAPLSDRSVDAGAVQYNGDKEHGRLQKVNCIKQIRKQVSGQERTSKVPTVGSSDGKCNLSAFRLRQDV